MKHFIAIAAVMLAACASAPVAGSEPAQNTPAAAEKSIYRTLTGKAPIVIAHRGASGLYPEHTTLSYRTAIAQGADYIEPDLVMTKDGVLIARHDPYLSATTNIIDHPEFADRKKKRVTPMGEMEDWWVDDFTLAEIKTLKARQQFDTRNLDHNDQLDILTFDEVLDIALEAAAEGKTVGLHIEAKWPGYYTSIGMDMADPILAALEKKGIREAGIPIYIQCFEPPFLEDFAKKSDLPLILNLVGEPYASMLGLVYDLDTLTTAGVGAEKSFVLKPDGTTTDFVDRAHAAGLLVHVYTVRDDTPLEGYADAEAELTALFAAGVDGVWVDYPETGVKVRNSLK